MPSLKEPVKKAGPSGLSSLFAQPFKESSEPKSKEATLPKPQSSKQLLTGGAEGRPRRASGLKGLATVEDSSDSSSDTDEGSKVGQGAFGRGSRRGGTLSIQSQPGASDSRLTGPLKGKRPMDLTKFGLGGMASGTTSMGPAGVPTGNAASMGMSEFMESEIASSPETSPLGAQGTSYGRDLISDLRDPTAPADTAASIDTAAGFEMDARDCLILEQDTNDTPNAAPQSPGKSGVALGSPSKPPGAATIDSGSSPLRESASSLVENQSVEVESDDSLEVEELFDDDF